MDTPGAVGGGGMTMGIIEIEGAAILLPDGDATIDVGGHVAVVGHIRGVAVPTMAGIGIHFVKGLI